MYCYFASQIVLTIVNMKALLLIKSPQISFIYIDVLVLVLLSDSFRNVEMIPSIIGPRLIKLEFAQH